MLCKIVRIWIKNLSKGRTDGDLIIHAIVVNKKYELFKDASMAKETGFIMLPNSPWKWSLGIIEGWGDPQQFEAFEG